jgi:cobalt-zinc-cadmium efflux system outer membrane protein
MHSQVLPRHGLALFAAVWLTGCAGLPADRGFDRTRQLVTQHGGPALPDPTADNRAALESWLAQPLTLDDAIRLSLSHNPELQRGYARLGIAQAEVYEAARIANPMFSISRLDGGGEHKLTLGISQNIAALLSLAPRRTQARLGLEQAQAETAQALLALAADTERAYYQLQGAEALAALRASIADAAEASALLAARYRDAGNLSALELAREQAAATEARIEAGQAAAEAVAARVALGRLFGLPPERSWTLARPLSLPVAQEDDPEQLRTQAQQARLDLVAARQQLAALDAGRSSARRQGFVDDLEVGVEREREPEGDVFTGPTASIPIPLFDTGAGHRQRAQSQWELAEAELHEREVMVSNDVWLETRRVAAARAQVAAYRNELLPQREAVVNGAQELQNFMLVGPFDPLLARQQAYTAYAGYLQALTGYWIARADLAAAVGSRLPSGEAANTPEVEPALAPAPAATQGGHGGHGGHGMHEMHQMHDHAGQGGEAAPAGPHDHASTPAAPASAVPADPHTHHQATAPEPETPAPGPGSDPHAHHHAASGDSTP